MFEEFARANAQENRRELDLKPTSWSPVANESERFTSPPPEKPAFSAAFDEPAQPASAHKKEPSAGLFKEAGGIFSSIRKFIKENEELIVFLVILFLICDCDDDWELIIALIILFYPYISKLIFRK